MTEQRGAILRRIFLINLLIPLLLGVIREQIVGIWNPRLEMDLTERIVFSLQPPTIGAIVALSLVAYFVIARFLRPAFRFLESGTDARPARRAAVRIPWVLMFLHVGGWIVGTFILYAFVFRWSSPGGTSFFWSLMISVSTGLATGVLSALAVNSVLLETKRRLGIKEILDGERDVFVRCKDYLVLGAALYLQTVHIVHLAIYYVDPSTTAQDAFGFPASMAIVAVYGAVLFIVMLMLSKKEFRFQTDLLSSRIAALSESGGDLRHAVLLINFDELGEIVGRFNEFMATLTTMILEVRRHTETLARTGDDLAERMSSTATSIELNTQDIQRIHDTIVSQGAAVTQATAAIEQVARTAEELRGHITNQSAGVTQSSAAVEQMVANIATITSNLEQVSAVFERLTAASDAGLEKIEYAVDQAQAVARQSEALAEANQLISSVAARTNLLAMNAAIEAAHAGDAGRGFAVVADEIRKLAETTAEQSKRVGEEIRVSLEEIERVVSAAGEAQVAFGSVRELVDETNDLEHQIVAAMDEQRAGGREVLEALASITEITNRVESASGVLEEQSSRMSSAMASVQALMTSVGASINAINERTGEIDRSVKTVTELGSTNRSNIDGVNAVVGRFRVTG
ncbi:MAG: methyl-accepting chemotaxis protein [Spirochaetota bacterium]